MSNTVTSSYPFHQRQTVIRLRRAIALGLLTVGCVTSLTTPAYASTLPRIVPTRVPSSYTVELVEETASPQETDQFVSYMHNAANDQAIATFADPYEKKAWDRDLVSYLDAETKVTKIRGQKAFVVETSSNTRMVTWFEHGRLFTSFSINVDITTQRRSADAIVITGTARASFVAKSAPKGLAMVYTGPMRALTSGYSTVTYVADPKNTHSHLYVDVRRIDPRYVDLMFLNPLAGTSTPISVNGKRGYSSVLLSGNTTVWYQEQPGLLVDVTSDVLTADALIDLANSMTPVDEASWKNIVQEAADFSANQQVPQDLVGAGIVDSQAWTAQVAARSGCLVFTLALTPTQACVKSPHVLGWSSVSVKDKTFAVGVTAANVATVVMKIGGVEVARSAVSAVIGEPTLRLFVLAIPANSTDVVMSGLDANGADIQSPISSRM